MQRADVFSCSMSSCDKITTAKEIRKRSRIEKALQYKEKVHSSQNQLDAVASIDLKSSSSEEENLNAVDKDFRPRISTIEKNIQPHPSTSNENFQTSDIAAALDRTNITDRTAAVIV